MRKKIKRNSKKAVTFYTSGEKTPPHAYTKTIIVKERFPHNRENKRIKLVDNTMECSTLE